MKPRRIVLVGALVGFGLAFLVGAHLSVAAILSQDPALLRIMGAFKVNEVTEAALGSFCVENMLCFIILPLFWAGWLGTAFGICGALLGAALAWGVWRVRHRVPLPKARAQRTNLAKKL